MIKKILNWTVGSFFRTIGRVFAFLVISILLILIGSKLGFKIPLIGVIDVKADVINFSNARFQNYFIDKSDLDVTQFPSKGSGYLNLGTSYTSPSPYNYWSRTDLLFDVTTRSNSIYRGSVYFDFNNSNVTNTDTSDYTLYIEGSTSTNTSGLNNNFISNVSFEFKKVSNATNRMVLIFNFTSTSQLKLIWVSIRTSANSAMSGSDFNVNLIKVHNLDIEEFLDDTTGAIENNTAVIGGKLDDVNDTLTSDDITGASDTANSFFSDFNDNSHGLHGIVTAPLVAVNAMLNGTCVAPGVTFKGVEFHFPCGDILWNQEGGTAFKNFINLIYGGLICYGIVRSLFKDVEDLKNPDNDKVEVTDL